MYDPWTRTKEGDAVGRGCAGQRGIKERKKWDNCNSIINKIYLKRKKNKQFISHFMYFLMPCLFFI